MVGTAVVVEPRVAQVVAADVELAAAEPVVAVEPAPAVAAAPVVVAAAEPPAPAASFSSSFQ